MNEQFNDWWNGDDLTTDNPFRRYSPAYWGWEGWVAGVKAEREACAKLAQETICDTHIPTGINIYGTRVAKAIRARSNHGQS
jgi:hypothetical protein